MQKTSITQSTTVDEMVRLDPGDGPSYPLLEFDSFGEKHPRLINVTKANYPRKSERCKGNVEVLTASTAEGWAVKCWPFSIFRSESEECLFDHRHLLESVNINNYVKVPVAYYKRRTTSHPILDSLSDDSVMTLSGLYANATDGTINAVLNDFSYVIKLVIEKENLPLTSQVVNLLLDISGAKTRYSNRKSFNTIINAVLNTTKSSTRVFNNTEEEIKSFIKERPFFGYNNESKVDNVQVRFKTIDERQKHRYASDVLKYGFTAFEKNGRMRILVASSATSEVQIENDRKTLIETMEEQFKQPMNFFRNSADKVSNGMINLPSWSIYDLPLEIWAVPQIEGEDMEFRLM